jgi:predicted negative regulator of RcsB-dependent stress response
MQSGKTDDAKTALGWASEQGKDTALSSVARLRLVSVLLQSKEYDEASKVVAADPVDTEYLGVFQDRRGDVLSAKGDNAAAIESYKKAFASSAAKPELQRLVRIKLNALGVDVEPVVTKVADAGKTK